MPSSRSASRRSAPLSRRWNNPNIVCVCGMWARRLLINKRYTLCVSVHYTAYMKRGPKPKGKVKILWSPEFAYAIGLLVADGCVLNDGRHIDLTSKDRAQIETFKKCLKLDTKISTKFSGAGNMSYRVLFSDVLFRTFLIGIGIHPAKSKTISEVSVPDKYFSDFLRGYFDGDGCSYSFYDPVFPRSYRFYISFISASPDYIDWLRMQIQRFVGIKGHLSRHLQSGYVQLKYAKREALLLAQYMYQSPNSPSLRRKHLKIQESVRIIESRRGGEMADTLASGASPRKGVGVRISPAAQSRPK